MAKRDAAQQKLNESDKGHDKLAQALADLEAKVAKFEGKVSVAGESYSVFNAKAKVDILSARRRQDELLDMLVITLITCQVKGVVE